MAFRLKKAQIKAKAELVDRLKVSRAELDEALASHNAVIAEAAAFRDEIKDDWQSQYDDKSEKWQEGDAASDASSLIEAWEGAELDEMSFDTTDQHSDVLESLEDGV